MYRQSEKNLLSSNMSSTCSHNMVNFGLLTAEICWRVWATPVNFNGFRVLAAFLHGTLVVDVSQTLRHWTEGATYIRQGGHHVGHWPTFLVLVILKWLSRASICIGPQDFEQSAHSVFIVPASYFEVWTFPEGVWSRVCSERIDDAADCEVREVIAFHH